MREVLCTQTNIVFSFLFKMNQIELKNDFFFIFTLFSSLNDQKKKVNILIIFYDS